MRRDEERGKSYINEDGELKYEAGPAVSPLARFKSTFRVLPSLATFFFISVTAVQFMCIYGMTRVAAGEQPKAYTGIYIFMIFIFAIVQSITLYIGHKMSNKQR